MTSRSRGAWSSIFQTIHKSQTERPRIVHFFKLIRRRYVRVSPESVSIVCVCVCLVYYVVVVLEYTNIRSVKCGVASFYLLDISASVPGED